MYQIKSMLVETVSPYLPLQHVKVFPDIYGYLTSHIYVQELNTNLKNVS